MGVPVSDQKILWARAAGRCSICRQQLITDTNGSDAQAILGVQAHIVAKKRISARGISNLTEEQRNRYTNLILLCQDHHKEIDCLLNEYTVEVLHQIKSNHEAWVKQSFAVSFDVLDLLELISELKPILRWLHIPVRREDSQVFFQSLQNFWTNRNIALTWIDFDLSSGLGSLLSPLACPNLFDSQIVHYRVTKFRQAEYQFHKFAATHGIDWVVTGDPFDFAYMVYYNKNNVQTYRSDEVLFNIIRLNQRIVLLSDIVRV